MARHSKKIRNTARAKAQTAKQVTDAANAAIWRREFNPDYDQVMKRISTAPFQGLRNGQPPGQVV